MSFNFTITRVEKYANRVVAEEHAPSVEGIREQEVDVSLKLRRPSQRVQKCQGKSA